MITRAIISSFIFILFSCLLMAGDSSNYIKKLILNTEQQYQKVSDFQVEMEINLSVPGFRMPKKKFKVFFKQPNN